MAITLKEVRAKFPSYSEFSDEQFLREISDETGVPYETVASKLGYQPPVQEKEKLAEEKRSSGFSGLAGSVGRGFSQTGRSISAAGNTVTGDLSGVERVAQESKDAAEKETPEEQLKLQQDLQSIDREQGALGQIGDTLGAAARNPMGTAQMIVEQLPNSAVAMGSGFAGAKAGAASGALLGPAGAAIGGVVGFLGGMFLGNYVLEGGAKAIEKAEGGFTPEERDEVLKEGAVKAAVITGVDAATLKIGGAIANRLGGSAAVKNGAKAEAEVLIKAGVDMSSPATINAALAKNPALIKQAKLAGEKAALSTLSKSKKAGIAGTGLGLETVGEGAGEYLGELASTGKPDIVDATIESLAGMSQSAVETAYNYNRIGNRMDTENIKRQADAINAQQTAQDAQDIMSSDSVDEAIQKTAQATARKPVTGDVFDDPAVRNDVLNRVVQFTNEKGEIDAQSEETGQEANSQAEPRQAVLNETGSDERNTEIFLPDNTSLPAMFDVVEADSINPTLKVDENQPRDRQRSASEAQVSNIANKLNYKLVSDSPVMDVGAPVLSQDNSIIAGNGRFAGIKQAYQQGTANQYRDRLKADLASKGIDPAVVDSMQNPVLVRRVNQPIDAKKAAIQSNAGLSMQYSGLELARIDSERMKDLDSLDITDNGDIAINQHNMAMLKNVLADYNQNELGALTDKDLGLSQDGARRIRNAILHSAYGNSPTLERMVESTDSDLRNVVGALTKSAGEVAKVRSQIKQGSIPKELDITEDLIGATEKLAQLRSRNIPVDSYLQQQGLFGEEVNPVAREFMQYLSDNIRSQKKMVNFIKTVYDEIGNIDTSTNDIFGERKLPSTQEVIQHARKQVEPKQQELIGTDSQLGETIKPESKDQNDNAQRDKQGKDGRLVPVSKRNKEDRSNVVMLSQSDDYKGEHKAPSRNGGAPLNDLTGNGDIYPDDVYSINAARYYGDGEDKLDKQTFAIAHKYRNKPDAAVTIYRAIPKDVDAEINARDWVTINKQYAINHGRNILDGDYKIISKKVKASEVYTNGDSIHEWGYDPDESVALSNTKVKGKGLSPDEVTQAVSKLRAKWTGSIKLKVVESTQDLPKNVHERSMKGEIPHDTDGLYDPRNKTVYLIAGNIATPERAVWVAIHETVGHAGLRSLDKTLTRNIDFAAKNKFVQDLGKAIAADRKEVYDADIHTEEAIAELSAALVSGDMQEILNRYGIEVPANARKNLESIIQRVIEALRSFVANMMGKVTDQQIRELILQAKAAVERGANVQFDNDITKQSRAELSLTDEFNESDYRPSIVNWAKNKWGNAAAPDGSQVWENFVQWFGDSKAVNAKGEPMEVYHGTRRSFTTFDLKAPKNSNRSFRDGFYFTSDRLFAQKHAADLDGKWDNVSQVMKVYLKIESDKDGKITRSFYSGHEYVVYRPELIKSSDENSGKFDSDKQDIRESRAATLANAGVNTNTTTQTNTNTLPEETKLEGFRRKVQDSMIRFERLQEWVKEQGINLTEDANVHQRANLAKGKQANAIEDFRRDTLKPLIKKIADNKFKLDDIVTYLEAVHIPESNARMRQIHKDPNATANGITDAQANKIVADYKQMPNFKEFEKLANEVRKIGEDTLDMRLNAGLISQEQYDAYKNTYKHWVPLRGDSASTQGTGKGLSVKSKDKRRFGHGLRDNEMILENLVQDRERTLMTIEKNKVAMSVLEFIMQAKNDKIGTVGKPEKMAVLKDHSYAIEYKGQTVGSFETKGAADAAVIRILNGSSNISLPGAGSISPSDLKVVQTFDPRVTMMAKPMLADNEIQVMLNGHAVRIQLNDAGLARAATGAGIDQVGSIIAAARDFNRFLSKAYTSLSPDFFLTNMARDAYSGSLVLTGARGSKFAAKTFANYGKSISDLWKSRNNPNTSKWVKRYREAGGNIGAAWLSDLDRLGSDAVNALQEFAGARETYRMTYNEQISNGASDKKAVTMALLKAGKVKVSTMPMIGNMFEFIEKLNGVIENSLRLAAFRTAIEAGETDQQAAMLAKNLINFNRSGEQTKTLGGLYLFFNPAIQSAELTAQALFKSEHRAQVWTLLGGLTALSFLLNEIGRGDDEDEWEKIPDFIKDRNLVVKVGGLQFTAPVSYGWGFAHAFGRYMSDYLHGEDASRVAVRLAGSFVENFSPVGNPVHEGDQASQFSAFQLLPTIPKMIAGPSVNMNSFGGEIHPKRYSESVPDSQLATRATRSTVYQDLANFLNDATGGSQYSPGLVSVSPDTIKFAVTSLTGGAGRFISDIFNGMVEAGHGVAPELENIPVARKFVRQSGVKDSRSAFWKAANEAKAESERFNKAVKQGDVFFAQKQLDENGDIVALAKFARSSIEMANSYRDAVLNIQNDNTLTKSEKKVKIKEMEVRENEIYNNFLRTFKEAKKK